MTKSNPKPKATNSVIYGTLTHQESVGIGVLLHPVLFINPPRPHSPEATEAPKDIKAYFKN